MLAHRIETTIQPDGTLSVSGLPVVTGTHVEIIVLVTDQQQSSAYPLRGTPYRLDDPTEPAVSAEAWEATR